jgi:hypothetical protein
MDSLLPFLVGILAGLGMSTISLGLFVAMYRKIRESLEAGPEMAPWGSFPFDGGRRFV